MDKEERLKQFLAENPAFVRYSPSRLENRLAREERKARKLDMLHKIAELRFQNNVKVTEIAKIVGLKPTGLHEKIARYLR